eukprot:9211776-Alexandrium_andersonii.AAC.1
MFCASFPAAFREALPMRIWTLVLRLSDVRMSGVRLEQFLGVRVLVCLSIGLPVGVLGVHIVATLPPPPGEHLSPFG